MTFAHSLKEAMKPSTGKSSSSSRSRSHVRISSISHVLGRHSEDTSGQDERPFYVPDSEATISERHASRSTVSQRSLSTSDDRQTRRESTEDYDSDEDSDDSDSSMILPAEAESIIGGSCISLGLPSHPQVPSNAEHNREEDKSSTDSFRKTIESASEDKTDYSHDADDWEPFCRGSQRGSQAISVPGQHSHLPSPNLTEDSPSNGFKIFSFSLPFTIPTAPSLPTLKELREFKIGRSSSSQSSKSSGRIGSADHHVSSSSSSPEPSLRHQGHERSLMLKYRKKAIALPIFNSSPRENTKDRDQLPPRQQTRDRPEFQRKPRQDFVDDEAKFSHVHQMDNARLRAVKENLLTSISMEQLNLFSSGPKDDFPDIDGDVVIMGGYRGSILRHAKTRRRVWIPIKVGLNIRKINLEIGLSDEDEANVEQDIIPDGILSHIGPIDISRKLAKRLQANPNCRVHEFGYDWRLSPDNISNQMVGYLRSLKQTSKEPWKGPIVVAHSMGGLIAHGAMQQDPSLFRGLLYVGSPISCVNILGPLRNGENVLLSSKVLSAQVNFTIRSSFVFMPLDGRCFVDKTTGEEIRLDYFDVNTWVKYRLSPCAAPPRTGRLNPAHEEDGNGEGLSTTKSVVDKVIEPRSLAPRQSPPPQSSSLPFVDAVDYLQRTLVRTKKFKESLAFDPRKKYPPLAVVYGRSVPTVSGSRVFGERDILEGCYSDLIFGPGDGVVHARHLMPPKGFQISAEVESERGHVGLLGDVPCIGKALKAILDEEKRREREVEKEMSRMT